MLGLGRAKELWGKWRGDKEDLRKAAEGSREATPTAVTDIAEDTAERVRATGETGAASAPRPVAEADQEIRPVEAAPKTVDELVADLTRNGVRDIFSRVDLNVCTPEFIKKVFTVALNSDELWRNEEVADAIRSLGMVTGVDIPESFFATENNNTILEMGNRLALSFDPARLIRSEIETWQRNNDRATRTEEIDVAKAIELFGYANIFDDFHGNAQDVFHILRKPSTRASDIKDALRSFARVNHFEDDLMEKINRLSTLQLDDAIKTLTNPNAQSIESEVLSGFLYDLKVEPIVVTVVPARAVPPAPASIEGEPSMEDILASIRRHLREDGDQAQEINEEKYSNIFKDITEESLPIKIIEVFNFILADGGKTHLIAAALKSLIERTVLNNTKADYLRAVPSDAETLKNIARLLRDGEDAQGVLDSMMNNTITTLTDPAISGTLRPDSEEPVTFLPNPPRESHAGGPSITETPAEGIEWRGGTYTGKLKQIDSGELIPHGKGTFSKEHTSYKGLFTDGEFEATQRAVTLTQNGITYKGDIIANQAEGHGIQEQANGVTIIGEFVDGKWNSDQSDASIIEEQNDGSVLSYSGEIAGNLPNGQGKQSEEKDGKVFVSEGIWEAGKLKDNTQAKINFFNGTKYEGIVHNGKANGEGVMSYPQGYSIKGQFRDNNPIGYVEFIKSNGSIDYAKVEGNKLRIIKKEQWEAEKAAFVPAAISSQPTVIQAAPAAAIPADHPQAKTTPPAMNVDADTTTEPKTASKPEATAQALEVDDRTEKLAATIQEIEKIVAEAQKNSLFHNKILVKIDGEDKEIKAYEYLQNLLNKTQDINDLDGYLAHVKRIYKDLENHLLQAKATQPERTNDFELDDFRLEDEGQTDNAVTAGEAQLENTDNTETTNESAQKFLDDVIAKYKIDTTQCVSARHRVDTVLAQLRNITPKAGNGITDQDIETRREMLQTQVRIAEIAEELTKQPFTVDIRIINIEQLERERVRELLVGVVERYGISIERPGQTPQRALLNDLIDIFKGKAIDANVVGSRTSPEEAEYNSVLRKLKEINEKFFPSQNIKTTPEDFDAMRGEN